MAMNYQNFASLGVNLNRQKYGPLDISNAFTSENDLKYYLTKGEYTTGVSEYWYKNDSDKVVPYPYDGQILATAINGIVKVYSLVSKQDGSFDKQEIALSSDLGALRDSLRRIEDALNAEPTLDYDDSAENNSLDDFDIVTNISANTPMVATVFVTSPSVGRV